jgi:hypothetical protein
LTYRPGFAEVVTRLERLQDSTCPGAVLRSDDRLTGDHDAAMAAAPIEATSAIVGRRIAAGPFLRRHAGAAEVVSPCGRQRAARRIFFVARAQRMRKASDGGIQSAWIATP